MFSRPKRSKRQPRRREQVGARTREQTNWINPRGNSMFGFPDRMITTLSFWEQNSPTWTAETYKIYSYRGTSCFDPRTAAGGLQPEGFDLFALVYSSYRVLGCKCTISVSGSTTGNVPVTMILCPVNADPTGLTGSQFLALANNPYGKKKLFNVGGPAVSLSTYMTAARMFGSEMVNTDDNFAALVSTNPVNNFFFGLGLYAGTTLTATLPYFLNVTLEYKVQFYDRFSITDTETLAKRLASVCKRTSIVELPPVIVPGNPGTVPVLVSNSFSISTDT